MGLAGEAYGINAPLTRRVKAVFFRRFRFGELRFQLTLRGFKTKIPDAWRVRINPLQVNAEFTTWERMLHRVRWHAVKKILKVAVKSSGKLLSTALNLEESKGVEVLRGLRDRLRHMRGTS